MTAEIGTETKQHYTFDDFLKTPFQVILLYLLFLLVFLISKTIWKVPFLLVHYSSFKSFRYFHFLFLFSSIFPISDYFSWRRHATNSSDSNIFHTNWTMAKLVLLWRNEWYYWKKYRNYERIWLISAQVKSYRGFWWKVGNVLFKTEKFPEKLYRMQLFWVKCKIINWLIRI